MLPLAGWLGFFAGCVAAFAGGEAFEPGPPLGVGFAGDSGLFAGCVETFSGTFAASAFFPEPFFAGWV